MYDWWRPQLVVKPFPWGNLRNFQTSWYTHWYWIPIFFHVFLKQRNTGPGVGEVWIIEVGRPKKPRNTGWNSDTFFPDFEWNGDLRRNATSRASLSLGRFLRFLLFFLKLTARPGKWRGRTVSFREGIRLKFFFNPLIQSKKTKTKVH